MKLAWFTQAFAWWTQVFVRSFSHYVIFPAMLLLILILLFAPTLSLGVYVGIPDAVNHEDTLKRLLVGCSFGVLWLTVLYCGYLLWLKDCREGRVLPPADWDELTTENRGAGEAPAKAERPPAHVVSFYKYAGMISLYFVGTLVTLLFLVVAARWVVGNVAGIVGLHIVGIPGVNLPEEDMKRAAVADAAKACEEPYFTSMWVTIPMLWGMFIATVAGLPLLGQWVHEAMRKKVNADEDQPLMETKASPDTKSAATKASPDAKPAWMAWYLNAELAVRTLLLGEKPSLLAQCWMVAWIVSGLLLFALSLSEPESMDVAWLRPALIAGVFLAGGGGQLLIHYVTWSAPSRPWWNFGVGLLWVVYLLAAYAVITYFFSQDWVLGWTVALAFFVVTRVLWHFGSAPIHWAWTALGAPVIKPQDKGERGARDIGSLLALLGVGFYVFICAFWFTQSPATFACFFFYGVVIFYAGLSLHLHRAKLVIVAFFLFAFVFSGVQAYHYRFPGLLEFYHDDRLRHLAGCKAEDEQQPTLDTEIAAYAKLIIDKGISKEFETFDGTPEAVERMKKLMADPEAKAGREKLLATWREYESKNHIIPVRLPAQNVIEILKFGEGTTLPASSPPLIPLEDVEFEPGPPVVVVAISGGGIRSAAWAFVVLKELELHFAKEKIDLPHRIRVVTGASGGMLGASYYIDLLADPDVPFKAPKEYEAKEEWDDLTDRRQTLFQQKYCNNLTKDQLTPIMQQMVLGDLPSLFSPWPSKYDRGQALEDAWAENLGKVGMGRTFKQIHEDERTGKRPFLVFAPMLIEDGRRLLISNLDLRAVVQNTGNLLVPTKDPPNPSGEIYSREALEMFRLFPKAHDKLKLSTAIRMSASFPFFSPAVSLPTLPRRRVVDAGYYDNYGISLASSWLFSQRNAKSFERTSNRFLIIQIRDTLSDSERALTKVKGQMAASSGRFAEEIGSPIEGLFNSRDGSSGFRNDGQLELLTQFMLERKGANRPEKPFSVVTFELDRPAPLSWQLSIAERNHLWQAIKHDDHQLRMKKMVEWWNDKSRERN